MKIFRGRLISELGKDATILSLIVGLVIFSSNFFNTKSQGTCGNAKLKLIDDALNFASIRSFHVVQSAGNGLVRIVCLAKRIQRVQESFATPLLDHEITAADLEPINHSFTRLVPLL